MRKQQLIALLLGSLLLASAGCVKKESLPTEQDAQSALLHTINQQMGLDKAFESSASKRSTARVIMHWGWTRTPFTTRLKWNI